MIMCLCNIPSEFVNGLTQNERKFVFSDTSKIFNVLYYVIASNNELAQVMKSIIKIQVMPLHVLSKIIVAMNINVKDTMKVLGDFSKKRGWPVPELIESISAIFPDFRQVLLRKADTSSHTKIQKWKRFWRNSENGLQIRMGQEQQTQLWQKSIKKQRNSSINSKKNIALFKELVGVVVTAPLVMHDQQRKDQFVQMAKLQREEMKEIMQHMEILDRMGGEPEEREVQIKEEEPDHVDDVYEEDL